jgi:hypothetical protein
MIAEKQCRKQLDLRLQATISPYIPGSVNIVHLQDPQESLDFVDSSQTTGAVQKCTDHYAHMHDRGWTLQA